MASDAPAGGQAPAANQNQSGWEQDAKVLTISEVAVLFEEYLQRTQQRDADYQPNPMLLKAADYANHFTTNRNKETLQKIRELLANHHLSELELGVVANLNVETVEEARKLVPTLDDPARFPDDVLENMLKELATYRECE